KIEVQPSQIRDQYQEMMRSYQARFKQRCGEFNITFVEVDIKQPYDKVLQDYLLKRRSLT
ncbi:MAG: DUF58 domain-containing protein, partial [Bacteroidota bacterium]